MQQPIRGRMHFLVSDEIKVKCEELREQMDLPYYIIETSYDLFDFIDRAGHVSI